MSLHVETQGNGPDLVLVHGWGVNSGVWQAVLPALAQQYRVSCVDLPGHGASRAIPMSASLAAVAAQVLAAVPMPAIWLGWSLGGLICLQLALQAPAQVRRLLLSNTTPKFVSGPDWAQAMPPDQLQAFAAELAEDFTETVRRFLAVQVLGDESARATLQTLRATLRARGEADTDSLAAGLVILRDSDLRQELPRIAIPTLVMAGEYDRLTPPQAGEVLAHRIANAEYVCFPRTAHAPFISHPQAFMRTVNGFLHRKSANPAHAHTN